MPVEAISVNRRILVSLYMLITCRIVYKLAINGRRALMPMLYLKNCKPGVRSTRVCVRG